MKASQLGMVIPTLTAAWGEFKRRGGAVDVEAEATSGPMEFDGLPFQVVVIIKLVPLVKRQAA